MPKIPSPFPKKRARIEIIPLIDVIFFLLATFIMVSLSMVKNQGVNVKLPVASTAAPQERGNFTTITVTESGEFFFNRELVDLQGLRSHLQEIKLENPDPKVFLNAAADSKFQHVVAVLDESRKLGITKIAIETEQGRSGE
jgi:biopolymer transport protein ExbD